MILDLNSAIDKIGHPTFHIPMTHPKLNLGLVRGSSKKERVKVRRSAS